MRYPMSLVVAAFAALLTACAVQTASPSPLAAGAASEAKPPVTILVSIDGFRADYLDQGVTPNLSELAESGVSAAMQPSFPSKTFPNHWALVTGEYPDHNGITANTMEDPRRPGETFTMANDDPFWWNEAKPVWVTAEQAGIRTATMFWPGSNVAWGGRRESNWPHKLESGTRPSDWQAFNQSVSGQQRVNAVLDWLRRPADIRPKFVTLYFDTVDTAGHMYGPDDERTTQAVADIDALIGMLREGLTRLHQPANLIIVADHGMAAISKDRAIALDQIASRDWYRLIDSGPFAGIVPAAGHVAEVEQALLTPHPHMQCWRRGDIPARFHYGRNPRVPALFCLAETGWQIVLTAAGAHDGGTHGYDNRSPEMAALFVASGLAFKHDVRLPPFPNVDVEPLLRELVGLPPNAEADGDASVFAPALNAAS